MEVTANAHYLGTGFQIQSELGRYTLISDRRKEEGGTALGPDALQQLLGALATGLCASAIDLSRQKKIALSNLSVSVRGLVYPQYTGKPVSAFNHVHYQIDFDSGLNPTEKKVFIQETEKNCGVYQVLSAPTALVREA